MPELNGTNEEHLYRRVAGIIEAARTNVARSVNTTMVHAYWLIGREIVEVEQRGEKRAGYGEGLMERLAARLSERFGKGFSARTLRRVRSFYLTFPNGSALSPEIDDTEIRTTPLSKSLRGQEPPFPQALAWSHYLVLMKVKNQLARGFYEIEAVKEGWSVRELERQIASLLFERLASSQDKEKVLTLAKAGQTVSNPRDVIKDPFVLEFLGLQEKTNWLERDLEQAIIDHLESFLLELGKGFCFVGRQKRLTVDGDHFYVDLVFYNRLLRCFVLVDLKLGKLTHQDLGQIQMYVNYYDRFQRQEWERPTVGIVVCSAKNDAMVKITLPEDNEQILAASYQSCLPTEEQLRQELVTERDRLEQARRLAAATSPSEGDD